MPRFHNINGKRIPFIAEEETARDAEEAAWASDQAIRDAKHQIGELEGQITTRRLREAILNTDSGWLAALESRIVAERHKLR